MNETIGVINFRQKYEDLIGKKLSDKEYENIFHIKNTLNIRDNDALWTIILALQYHKKLYEDIPQKIIDLSSSLSDDLKMNAEAYKKIGEAKLIETLEAITSKLSSSVINESKIIVTYTLKIRLLFYCILFFCFFILYGSCCFYFGYIFALENLDAGSIMRIPSGFLISSLAITLGFGSLVLGSSMIVYKKKEWKKTIAFGFFLILVGTILILFI